MIAVNNRVLRVFSIFSSFLGVFFCPEVALAHISENVDGAVAFEEATKEEYIAYDVKASPYNELCKRLKIDENEVTPLLTSELETGIVTLVPLEDSEGNLDLWRKIFVDANPKYMENYAWGKLLDEVKMKKNFKFRLNRMWGGKVPKSMTFVVRFKEKVVGECDQITYKNEVPIGKLSIGPLIGSSKVVPTEMDYILLEDYANKGIATRSVELLTGFIIFLKKKKKYDINEIRITANEKNIASQKVAEKNGYTKLKNKIVEFGFPTFDYRKNIYVEG